MGLFDRLFGKNNKKEKEEKKERRALGLKDEVAVHSPKAEAKPAEKKPAPKAEAKPADKKPAPKAEAKPAEKKPAPKAEAKPAEKKPALKAEAKPAEKKPAPKAEAKPADKKPAPKAQTKPTEAEEAEAERIAEEAQTVEVAEVGTGATGRFEIKKSKDGRFVFNLYAKNHVIVATSQVYSSSTSAVGGIKSVIANAPTAPIEDQTLKSYEPQGYPKWEIYQDKGGQYRFRLSAPNGSCICHSQGYTNKTNCKNGIQSIIRSAKDAEIDKIYLKKDD